jgi:leucyl/phenylalanyl-tRNA--protein transferase
MPLFFRNPARCDADGLVAVGGDLTPEHMLEAYSRGIFPFFDDSTPTLWWSPDPRAIIELDGLHVSRRLARTLRSGKFTHTIDHAFEEVVRACAVRAGQGVWITETMVAGYLGLHRLGHAHSLEVWCEGELAGGVFGVTVGGFMAGESMFTRVTDGSKVALAFLFERLNARGFRLFDVQYINPHTESLGAIEIPRRQYLARLAGAVPVRTSLVDPA